MHQARGLSVLLKVCNLKLELPFGAVPRSTTV